MTKKTDLTRIDRAVLDAITSGGRRANDIECRIAATAREFLSGPHDSTMRVVDHRLQALRRARRIAYDTTFGWNIA